MLEMWKTAEELENIAQMCPGCVACHWDETQLLHTALLEDQQEVVGLVGVLEMTVELLGNAAQMTMKRPQKNCWIL